jgi:hypothetical protein
MYSSTNFQLTLPNRGTSTPGDCRANRTATASSASEFLLYGERLAVSPGIGWVAEDRKGNDHETRRSGNGALRGVPCWRQIPDDESDSRTCRID